VSVSAGDGEVVVAVEDDGPGIPDDIQSRLFEPFFTTKAVGQGTGLGLDIARRIVEAHRGTLGFTSEPGRTRFTVRLPAGPVGPRG
jgi:signal transduction histidine kinase